MIKRHTLSLHGSVPQPLVLDGREAPFEPVIAAAVSSLRPTFHPLQERENGDHDFHLSNFKSICNGNRGVGPWTQTCCLFGGCLTIIGTGGGGPTNPGPAQISPTPNSAQATLTTSKTPSPHSSSYFRAETGSPSVPTTVGNTVASLPSTTHPSGPVESSRRPNALGASDRSPAVASQTETVTLSTTIVTTATNPSPSAFLSGALESSFTTTSSPSSSPRSGALSQGVRPGVIAAIIPVIVVFVVLCVGMLWICKRRRARQAEASTWKELNDTSSNHLTEVSYGTRSWFWGSEGGGSAAATSDSPSLNPDLRALVAALFTHRPATAMSQQPPDGNATSVNEKRNPDVPVDVTAECSTLQTTRAAVPCRPESDCYLLSSSTSLFSGSAHAV